MAAEFYRGSVSTRDYTPGTAVTGGDVIAISSQLYVAHLDIAANAVGGLACATGGAAYKVDTDGVQTIADGAQVLYNTTAGEIDGTGVHFGYSEGGCASGDTTTIVRHAGKLNAEVA